MLLRAAARGQEFVLDLDIYPELQPWLLETTAAPGMNDASTGREDP